MLCNTSSGSATSAPGELVSSFFKFVPFGTLDATGRLSVELPNDATDNDDVLGLRPGLRGNVLGPSCTDRLGPGKGGRLGEAVGVEWLECPEKRSSHMLEPDIGPLAPHWCKHYGRSSVLVPPVSHAVLVPRA